MIQFLVYCWNLIRGPKETCNKDMQNIFTNFVGTLSLTYVSKLKFNHLAFLSHFKIPWNQSTMRQNLINSSLYECPAYLDPLQLKEIHSQIKYVIETCISMLFLWRPDSILIYGGCACGFSYVLVQQMLSCPINTEICNMFVEP